MFPNSEVYCKVWLISACAYFVSGKNYALIICVCKTRVLKLPYRDQCSLNTTGLQCMHFSQQQSSTDLNDVACNLGKPNAGAKICASNYRTCFALSTGTADYLATCSYPLKCCSVPYATYNSLLHAYNTRIHVHDDE